MSKGYIVIAQNNQTTDYIRQAYALALSLKVSQKKNNKLSICVTDTSEVPDKWRYAFDQVIEIPWGDHASESKWKVENKWKYYYMTPYDETVILDTDMIFTEDVSHWWDILSDKEVWATTNVCTFRGTVVTDNYYRKAFTSNSLPNVYTGFFYFKKTKLAAELFRMVNLIFQDWTVFYREFLDHNKPKHLSGDVAYALAMKILGIENECTNAHLDSVPTFVHMKSKVQNVKQDAVTENWTRHFSSTFSSDCKLKVNSFKQNLPFHYHIDAWLTEDIINKLEEKYDRR